jgi:hypothetical protein
MRAAAALAMLVTPFFAGCSLSDDRKERAGRPPTAVVVDETAASYRGVRIGSSIDDVRRVFGDSLDPDGFVPVGEQFTGPTLVRNPGGIRQPPTHLRYEGAAFLILGDFGVYAFVTTEEHAETRAGVGVGHPLTRVRDRYDSVTCGRAPKDAGASSYAWCMTRVGRVQVHFGGDPIESITIARAGLLQG